MSDDIKRLFFFFCNVIKYFSSFFLFFFFFFFKLNAGGKLSLSIELIIYQDIITHFYMLTYTLLKLTPLLNMKTKLMYFCNLVPKITREKTFNRMIDLNDKIVIFIEEMLDYRDWPLKAVQEKIIHIIKTRVYKKYYHFRVFQRNWYHCMI